jgi:hypothetical protein
MAPMNNRLMRPRATGLTDPRTITGLELWLDFNDSSTLTLSGTSISEARDKSGKGWKAVQATGANQPTLTSSAINGKSAATFDASNDNLTIASFPAITQVTAFAVYYRNWSTNIYRAIAGMNYGATAGMSLFLTAQAAQNDWQTGDIACFGDGFNTGRAPRALGPGLSLSNGTPAVLSAVLSSTTAGVWQNGTSIATRVATAGACSITSATLFVGSNGAFDYSDATLAALLIYRATLTTAQRKSVEKWLGGLYGVTVA